VYNGSTAVLSLSGDSHMLVKKALLLTSILFIHHSMSAASCVHFSQDLDRLPEEHINAWINDHRLRSDGTIGPDGRMRRSVTLSPPSAEYAKARIYASMHEHIQSIEQAIREEMTPQQHKYIAILKARWNMPTDSYPFRAGHGH